ncbi:MAG: hypothetical protein QM722_09965 [Piscinibacter sp.]
MSSINSLASAYVPANTQLGSYERNAKAFGPVVATVLGAADAVGAAAESTCTFSSDALSRLGDSIGDGFAAVSDGIEQAADTIGSAAGDAVDTVGEFGGSVVDGVGDLLGSLAGYATTAGLAIGNALDETT